MANSRLEKTFPKDKAALTISSPSAMSSRTNCEAQQRPSKKIMTMSDHGIIRMRPVVGERRSLGDKSVYQYSASPCTVATGMKGGDSGRLPKSSRRRFRQAFESEFCIGACICFTSRLLNPKFRRAVLQMLSPFLQLLMPNAGYLKIIVIRS